MKHLLLFIIQFLISIIPSIHSIHQNDFIIISLNTTVDPRHKFDIKADDNQLLKYRKLATYNCNNISDCNYNGVCHNTTHCICYDHYTTVLHFPPHNIQCNYKQQSLNSVFFLSFFLGPIGIDHIYRGYYITGILKLTIPFFMIISGYILYTLGKQKTSNRVIVIGKVIEFSATLVIIIWWLVDWILFLTNVYKDRNGIVFYRDF